MGHDNVRIFGEKVLFFVSFFEATIFLEHEMEKLGDEDSRTDAKL